MCLLSFADGSLVGSQVLGGVLLLVVLHHVNEVGVLGYGQEHLHVELALLALGPLVKCLERLEEGGDLNTTLLNQPYITQAPVTMAAARRQIKNS